MIKYFLLLLFLLPVCLQAQNLVPNPSFEDTLGCPQGYPDLDTKCKFWKSFRITPDYMNNCSLVCGYYNQYGYQQPHTGKAYAGVLEYQITIPNAREHIGVQLNSPLVIGAKYFLSFFISPAFNYSYANIASNKMGALVTTYAYDNPSGTRTLPNACTVKIDSVVTDTLSWHKVFGSFTADSAYQYLVIGNFFDDSHIDTIHLPYKIVHQASYYYIDDVCLSTDSAYCQTWTLISEANKAKNGIELFPNPTTGIVNIKLDERIEVIEVISEVGQIMLTKEAINSSSAIDLKDVQNGLYFIRVKTNQHIYTSPINVIK